MLYWLSVLVFALNVLLISMGCIISILRYTLYPDLQGDDKALGAVHVHRNVSHGIGYYHQHDMFGLCTGMGRLGEVFCLGIVDFDAVVSVMTALSSPFLLRVALR